jgi:prolyl-tRNA synthetase
MVIPLNVAEAESMQLAEKAYAELQAAGIDVLFDDRDARPGFKFKDADLIGIPLRLIIGGKGLKEGVVEVKWRTDAEAKKVPVAEAVQYVIKQIADRKAADAAKVPA